MINDENHLGAVKWNKNATAMVKTPKKLTIGSSGHFFGQAGYQAEKQTGGGDRGTESLEI